MTASKKKARTGGADVGRGAAASASATQHPGVACAMTGIGGAAAGSPGASAVPTDAAAAAAVAAVEPSEDEPYVDPLPPTLLVIDRERPLKSLGESGLIPFGEKVLCMTYKDFEWWVNVRADGVLTHHGGDGTE